MSGRADPSADQGPGAPGTVDAPRRGETRLARAAHFSALWLLVGGVFVAGFVAGHSTLVAVAGWALAGLVVIGLLTTVDQGHLVGVRAEDPLLAVGAAGIAVCCVRLLGAQPILTSALVGIAGVLAARAIEHARDRHAGPIYVGAFVGGTAAAVLPSAAWVLAAGALAGALWSVSREAWVGIGGKMGTAALAGVLACDAAAHLAGSGGSAVQAPDSHDAFVAVVALASVSAPCTWLLAYRAGWGPVLGSAAPTAAFALLVILVPAVGFHHPEAVTAAWFSSSFVGMTAPERISGKPAALAVAGVICGLLLLAFGSTLAGMGGIAGATALISVFALRGGMAMAGAAATG